jgi:aryl-alcohol dehydrogenase-like predicted oxidoreductase
MYSRGRSEEITGKLLREMTRRDEVVLATKVFFPLREGPNSTGLSRKRILDGCDASLRRLGMDYIDLYQIHRFDPRTPLEETLRALSDLVDAGKVRYLGASSMAAWQFAKALYLAGERGWHRFVSMQNHYNLVYREEEREMIPLCLEEGVGLIPWSPLARGFLTGSRSRENLEGTLRARTDNYGKPLYACESNFKVLDAVTKVAAARGVSPARVALAWVLSVRGVAAPIVGATRTEHLRDALGALELRLDAEEITALEAPYAPRPVLGHTQPAR